MQFPYGINNNVTVDANTVIHLIIISLKAEWIEGDESSEMTLKDTHTCDKVLHLFSLASSDTSRIHCNFAEKSIINKKKLPYAEIFGSLMVANLFLNISLIKYGVFKYFLKKIQFGQKRNFPIVTFFFFKKKVGHAFISVYILENVEHKLKSGKCSIWYFFFSLSLFTQLMLRTRLKKGKQS